MRSNWAYWFNRFRIKGSVANSLAVFMRSKTPIYAPAASPASFRDGGGGLDSGLGVDYGGGGGIDGVDAIDNGSHLRRSG